MSRREGGRRGRRRNDGDHPQLFGDDEDGSGSGGGGGRSERRKGRGKTRPTDEPTHLERPEASATPAILKNDSPPAFKIMGGAEMQRKDQTPLRVTTRFLDEDLNLYTDELARHLTEHPDFTVVGVLGFQGAGKSRVLSELCGYRPETTSEGRSVLTGAFPEQEDAELLEGYHRTVGIDACLHVAEQLILLDVQPLLSASLLVQRMRQDSKDGGMGVYEGFISHENQVEMESLSLAVWLLSVCHVVLVVAERTVDLGLLQFLQTALLLQQHLDGPRLLPAVGSGSTAPHVAELSFVVNKCPPESWGEENQAQLQQLLDGFLGRGSVHFDLLPSGSPKAGAGGGGGRGRGGGRRGGGGGGDISYGVAVRQWRESLLRRLPPRGFGAAAAATEGAAPSTKPMSEREWLRASSRLWTAVRASAASDSVESSLGGYNVVLQQMPWQPKPGSDKSWDRDTQRQNRRTGGGRDGRDARRGEEEEEVLLLPEDGRDARQASGHQRDPSTYDPRDVRYRAPVDEDYRREMMPGEEQADAQQPEAGAGAPLDAQPDAEVGGEVEGTQPRSQ